MGHKLGQTVVRRHLYQYNVFVLGSARRDTRRATRLFSAALGLCVRCALCAPMCAENLAAILGQRIHNQSNGDTTVKSKKAAALLSVTALFLAACSSTPINTPINPTAGDMAKPATSLPAAPASRRPEAAATTPVPPVALLAYLDPKNLIATDRSVYFDFDEFVVKSQYTPLIERHGRYLASTPALAIRIEGNADERGSSEYDLALGQKRAEAVMRSLKLLGVKESQMEAISWGKEKPKASGHDEAAWAQNRRADVVYPAR